MPLVRPLHTHSIQGKFEAGERVRICLCVVFWIPLGTAIIFSFCWWWCCCFWNTKQLVCSRVVSLLTCGSGLWPCRQLTKGNNATLCPDLSLPSLMFRVKCIFSKDRSELCFPCFVELFLLDRNGYEMDVKCLSVRVMIWLLLCMSLVASKQKQVIISPKGLAPSHWIFTWNTSWVTSKWEKNYKCKKV